MCASSVHPENATAVGEICILFGQSYKYIYSSRWMGVVQAKPSRQPFDCTLQQSIHYVVRKIF